eukprot:TRINITY_DN757_c0_g1_i1.p2 TRINITY_DN757_c0_g1~~TRINITY_DN757_c0_g1_i1.p2  ORF type:complete len:453 (-),score=67.56 TRINITY_DN757_c0_g1_i1:4588-5946(-)
MCLEFIGENSIQDNQSHSMGTKKLLHKMPVQKRVPIKKKPARRPVAVKKSASTEPTPALEEICTVEHLSNFAKGHNLTLVGVLRKYMEQKTENAAFEAKGIQNFIKLCLDSVLENTPSELSSWAHEIQGLIEFIDELELSNKWAIIEWAQGKLKYYISIVDTFVEPTKEAVLHFICFIELVKGILCASEGIENPLLLSAVSIACRILQTIELTSATTALHFLGVLWETYSLCQENKQNLPESLAFITKLAAFMRKTASDCSEFDLKAKGYNTLSLIVDDTAPVQIKQIMTIKGTLSLLQKVSLKFANAGCYESVAGTVGKLVEDLAENNSWVNSVWQKYSEAIIQTSKHEDKIKEPLKLHSEKPKEVQTFEPIIDDDYLPFRLREKRLKVEVLEKKGQQNKKRAHRVEMRKMRKQTKIQEELRMEEMEYQREKQNQYLKKERKALEQDYMYI